MKMWKRYTWSAVCIVLISGLVACGSGSSSTSNSNTTTTYTVSGTVSSGSAGLQGVTMTLSGAASATVNTDTNGNYSFTNLANGNYTITPSKSGYAFTPASQSLTITGANSTGNNFTATTSGGTTTSLVGSWYIANSPIDNTSIVITFIDGSRFMYEEYTQIIGGSHPADSHDGIEYGTYTATASSITPSVIYDTNGGWGFSGFNGNSASYLVSSTTLTIATAVPATKISSSATNPLIGGWYFTRNDGHTGVLTFINDSQFAYAEVGPIDPGSHPGMERGTYTATANSVTFTVTEDTNGGWGMSNLSGTATPISISGNTLTISPSGGGGQAFTKVQ